MRSLICFSLKLTKICRAGVQASVDVMIIRFVMVYRVYYVSVMIGIIHTGLC